MNNKPIPALAQKDHIKYIRRRNNDGFRHKYALGHTERRQLIREAGVHALVLFEYYLRLASTENAVISDQDAADYFDWSRHTAKRHRLTLVKNGWVAIEKATLNNKRRIHVCYLGKDEVAQAGYLPEKKHTEKAKKEVPSPTSFIISSPDLEEGSEKECIE